MVKIVDIDHRLSKIVCDLTLFNRIRKFFSYPQVTWRNRKRVKYTAYLIGKTGNFRKGLCCEIKDYLKINKIPFVHEHLGEVIFPTIDEIAESFWFPKDEKHKDPYDYQFNAVINSMQTERGLWDLATSAGKSVTACMFINTFLDHHEGSKAMFVVNDVNLLYQAQSDFLEYGMSEDDITLWGDRNKPDFDKKLLIVIDKTLISDFELSYTFTNDRDLMFVDEVDLTANPKTQIHKLIDGHDANYRFGCTGTIPKDPYLKNKLIANFGPIISQKTAVELREKGVLTNCKVNMIDIKYSDYPDLESYQDEMEFIASDETRNEFLIHLCKSFEKNTLLLVDRIAQLEALQKIVRDEGEGDKQFLFMRGDVSSERRKEFFQIAESSDNVVIISIAKLFSRGVSVKNLHHVICSCLGKSQSKIIQTIGRSLRKLEKKDLATIYDLCDELTYAHRHRKIRLDIYEDEQLPVNFQNIIL